MVRSLARARARGKRGRPRTFGTEPEVALENAIDPRGRRGQPGARRYCRPGPRMETGRIGRATVLLVACAGCYSGLGETGRVDDDGDAGSDASASASAGDDDDAGDDDGGAPPPEDASQ